MSALKRTLTSSDIEGTNGQLESDSSSTTDISEWETDSLSVATSNHRRYRSGSQPDMALQASSWNRIWQEMGLVARLLLLIVTPFAARQLGSMFSRRMWAHLLG
jgi:hypothetical protein